MPIPLVILSEGKSPFITQKKEITMSMNFKGTALPLDKDGITKTIGRMGIGEAELWTVITVETRGCGFLPDRRPKILFERHIFSHETSNRFDQSNPEISNKMPGGYGMDGPHQYSRLEEAMRLEPTAALRSASWGIGQVLGTNAEISGYADVETMVQVMIASENEQISAMAGFIIHNGLHKALISHDWAAFARGYNGPGYAKNKYDTKLEAAYLKYMLGLRPDLNVRIAQVYLTYLGYQPGTIDGVPGQFTYTALNKFQSQNNLTITNEIDDSILNILKEKSLAGDS
jgi:hypothetical protein